jgi:hypothetical protein
MSPSDSVILDALRTTYYNLAVSGAQTYTILGRTFHRYDIEAIQRSIAWLEQRVDAATQPGIGGGTLLVKMGQIF